MDNFWNWDWGVLADVLHRRELGRMAIEFDKLVQANPLNHRGRQLVRVIELPAHPQSEPHPQRELFGSHVGIGGDYG